VVVEALQQGQGYESFNLVDQLMHNNHHNSSKNMKQQKFNKRYWQIDGQNSQVHQIVTSNKQVSLSFSTGIVVQLSN
jgi:hypothetical protein